MDKRELVCIRCPLGCMLSVQMEGDKVISVSGNTCSRGKEYAENEVTNPVRMVTSTVKVSGGERNLVSCKTKTDVPKERVFDVVRALKEVTVEAPVKIGDVLVEDIAGTGVQVVATANVLIK